jgi:hypothetical protein
MTEFTPRAVDVAGCSISYLEGGNGPHHPERAPTPSPPPLAEFLEPVLAFLDQTAPIRDR